MNTELNTQNASVTPADVIKAPIQGQLSKAREMVQPISNEMRKGHSSKSRHAYNRRRGDTRRETFGATTMANIRKGLDEKYA